MLGQLSPANFGQQITFGTDQISESGFPRSSGQVRPLFESLRPELRQPITIAVTPLTAVGFRVTPVVKHGKLNKPVSFTVTALNKAGQPLTNYTGTVIFSSPTDSFTILPKDVYIKYNLTPSAPPSSGLASFPISQYTFTPADHGSHTF